MSEKKPKPSGHTSKEPSKKVLQQVADELGMYVYMLVDPRNGLPFYVGKGQGLRFTDHGFEADAASEDEAEKKEKLKKIREINAAGYKHQFWILRYGMTTEEEYTAVEAAAIDLLHSFPLEVRPERAPVPESFMDQLTNARREASGVHGITLLDHIVQEKAATPLTVQVPMLLFELSDWKHCPSELPGEKYRDGHGYKPEWRTSYVREKHFEEIGLSTCAWWPINIDNAADYEYAVAVHRGVTRAIFRIVPGTWEEIGGGEKKRGFQFEPIARGDVTLSDGSDLYDEAVGEYGHYTPQKKKGDQTGFRYWPYQDKQKQN